MKTARLATIAALTALCFLAQAASLAHAVTIRSMDDLRIWQTAMNPGEPLKWPWINDSDSATLSISNLLTGAASSTTVAKAGSELYGSHYIAPPPVGQEALYSFELVLRAGGSEVARYSACVAHANGAAGRPITVRRAGKREWKRFRAPSLTTYDADWSQATTNSATLTVSAGQAQATTALPGSSGYTVISSASPGACRFDLGFDNAISAWSADLESFEGGVVIVFQ